MTQLDAVTQLRIEKGVIRQEAFYAKLYLVQAEHEGKRRAGKML